ncbi:hypothetical protein DFH07DRAFT_785870 [Mycena maculata]|uniref:DUF6818 domain-containing protein n=1 Tax=Mycena maculata TaxID=230809 RepID=A0AAD7MEK0_9AGAR|nr:hypothetical protein DFH07DRAFT_785870 [Mycena maculata]
MSDRTDPSSQPFAESAPPLLEIQYNSAGRPWTQGPDGQWTTAAFRPLQAPFQHKGPPASTQVPPYNFPPAFDDIAGAFAPSQASSSRHPDHSFDLRLPPLATDLRLPPLPDDDDPTAIVKSRGLRATSKVAGSRRKDKGKKRHHSSDSEEDSDAAPHPTKRTCGRPSGSSNFSKEDTKHMLDLVEKELPLGQKAWDKVIKRYNKWACTNKRPERPGKSLETKYKSLLKAKKPTGSGYCPPEVKRAHRIEDQINQRAGTRDVSDSEFIDAADSSDGSVELLTGIHTGPHTGVREAVAHRAPTPPLRWNPRMNTPELIFTMSQQLRDLQAANENLRNQMATMQARANEVERGQDRAELKLEMPQTSMANGFEYVRPDRPQEPNFVRTKGRVRCERIYPDGGACTYFIGDSDTDEAEKENKDPRSPRGYSMPSPRDDALFIGTSRPATPRPTINGAGLESAGGSVLAGSSNGGVI